jgi:hypothetical protein
VSGRPRRFLRKAACALAIPLVVGALAAPASAALPDGRGWEMVSPVEKNGGRVDLPESIAGGGVMQAAAQGGSVTYSSTSSFSGAAGAPIGSQYVAGRSADGWATANISVPIVSGSFDFDDRGVPYQLFSRDLSRSLLLNGDRCRGGAAECPVANPPLAGTDAPAGFQNYYLREGGGFEALIGAEDVAGRGLDPAEFEVTLAGASPDLKTVLLSTCAALTDAATDGCGSDEDNLYKWSQSSGALSLIAVAPGAAPAAPAGAVSADGSRIYWRDVGSGNLYLREGSSTIQVDAEAGGGGEFQTASADGAVAFFTRAGHLYRYVGGSTTDLTPAGGVLGVLGAAADGSAVYFQDGAALKRWSAGATTNVAPGIAADPSTYPPATGASRVTPDGGSLLFLSSGELTGYDNTDKYTGLPDMEVYLYDASAKVLSCPSCNRRGRRPIGPSTIPGAIRNGSAPGSVQAYKPRVLSANGRRVFFDSGDALVAADSNSNPTTGAGIGDVYQWEAQGEGDCALAIGCISVLSEPSLPSGASFADASADGADAYFLTGASLVGTDPGSMDLYDARVGGGLPEPPPPPIPCTGDACQVLPSLPSSPSLATLAPGAGNPPVSYRKYCRKGYVKRKGICVKKGRKHKQGKRKHQRVAAGGR